MTDVRPLSANEPPRGALHLAERARSFIDAVVHTDVPDSNLDEVARELERLTARLQQRRRATPRLVVPSPTGARVLGYNSVEGVLNPLAPPLVTLSDADGVVRAGVTLTGAYEGPRGRVHGGWLTLLLDHLLAKSIMSAGYMAMTVGLTVAFREGTPCDVPIEVIARYGGRDGRKLLASGEVRVNDRTTVQASGVFLPAASGAPNVVGGPDARGETRR